MALEARTENQQRLAELSVEIPKERHKIIAAAGFRRACDMLQRDIIRTLRELPENPATMSTRATLDAVIIKIIQTRLKADEELLSE